MKKVVVLTGAGISAESGIKTFRDSGGLWEGYDVMQVASPQGWAKDPELVLEFYNMRRRDALNAIPNEGHKALVKLEAHYDVTIITQNVDDLHEKAGSSKVLHLHGELFKSRSTFDESLIYDIKGTELALGDKCEKGYQLRPHIVWFGEMVPMLDLAVQMTVQADIFMVVGTSLQVYPAASLIEYVNDGAPTYVIDPIIPYVRQRADLHLVPEKASTGVPRIVEALMN